MREFVGIDLSCDPVPDETTIRKFRRLLEGHPLGAQIFAAVNEHLAEQGFKVGTGTIVDATIIIAPSSMKSRDGWRDAERHQTKKGNESHVGMTAHIGVDSRLKLIHLAAAAATNVYDLHLWPELLDGSGTAVRGDSAYQGEGAVNRALAPLARDMTHGWFRRGG